MPFASRSQKCTFCTEIMCIAPASFCSTCRTLTSGNPPAGVNVCPAAPLYLVKVVI